MSSSPTDQMVQEYASDLALCRCVLYQTLATGFRLPTPAMLSHLLTEAGHTVMSEAATALDAAWETDLLGYMHDLRRQAQNHTQSQLQASYGRLFGHIVRAAVPPYETEYGEDALFLPMQEMSDLGGFFQAFGLRRNDASHERCDHISSECEFMDFLAAKETCALQEDNVGMLQDVRQATRLFLRDHLGRWAPAFGHRLASEDAVGFYGTLGRLCYISVSADCRQHDVPAGPETLRLRAPLGADAPMACGTGSELLHIALPSHLGAQPCML